jgi:hypothetical protein
MNHTRPSGARQELFPTDSRYTKISRGLHAIVRTPRQYELAVALLEFRWFPDSPIIPSVKLLAETIRCSERTVRRTMAQMEADGTVRREERRAPDDRQMSNLYVLCGPLLALVTAVEATADQGSDQPWQGRRSRLSGEKNSGNYQKRSRPNERRYTPPSTGSDYLETRYGRLLPRT